MDTIIPFCSMAPEDMDEQQLQEQLALLRQRLEALDEKEPKNMNSEAYEQWAELHEDLEDQIDEVLDLLEDL